MTRHNQQRHSLALRALLATVLLAVTFAFLWTPAPATAQCSTPSTERALQDALTVFVGKVTSTEDSGRIAQVQVLAVWKGPDLPEFVEVRGTSGSATNVDRRFDVSKTYLVIPENTRAPYLASACSATQPFAGAAGLIPVSYQDEVGATETRTPIASDSPSDSEAEVVQAILPLLGVLALIVAAWAVIALRRSRASQSRTSFADHESGPQFPGNASTSTSTKRKPATNRSRRRSFRRDSARTEKVSRKTVKRHRRGLRGYRRRQERQLAESRKANGSTETS